MIQRFAWLVVFIAITTTAMAAADNMTSVEKARQAIGVVKSNAPGEEKAIACKQLAVYGNADAVPALAPLLSDEKLASWSRIALEAIPGRAADDALRDAMEKLQGKLLVGVINSIGVRGDARSVSTLTTKLQDSDVEVASAAAVSLGQIGGDPAAEALEKFLADAPTGVRPAVAQGCILCAEKFLAENKLARSVRLYDTVRKADVPKQRMIEATRGAILARKSDGLPLLLETLRSTDKAAFNMGLHTARELSGRAVTEALATELGRFPAERQGPLLMALADRTDAGVLPAILASARSGAKKLRLVAIELLVRLAKPAGVPVLLDTLAEGDADLEKAAKTALAGLSGDEVDKQLNARLPRASGNARRALVELAGLRHVTAAVPELIKAANEADPAIRAAGIKALGETVSASNLNALTDLLAKTKSPDEVSAVQEALESACSRIPDKAVCTDKLIASLPGSSVPARCALLRVLGVVSTDKALEAVRAAVASPEPMLRDTAVRVMASWADVAALPPLLEVFRNTKDETHRFLALRGCVRLLDLGGQPVAQTLKTYGELMARTERSDDRKAILSGLGNVHDPAALKLVEPLLANDQVQAEAEIAMLNIATGITKSAPAEARSAATKLQADSKKQATRDRAAMILSELDKSRR